MLEQQWRDEKSALQAEINRLRRQQIPPPANITQGPAAPEVFDVLLERHEEMMLDIVPRYVEGLVGIQSGHASDMEMLLKARQLETAAELESNGAQLDSMTSLLASTRAAHSEALNEREKRIEEMTSQMEGLEAQNASLGSSLMAVETLMGNLKGMQADLERSHATEASKRRDTEAALAGKTNDLDKANDELRSTTQAAESSKDELRRTLTRLEEETALRTAAEEQYEALHTEYVTSMEQRVEEQRMHSSVHEEGRHNSTVAEAQRAQMAAQIESFEDEVSSLRQQLHDAKVQIPAKPPSVSASAEEYDGDTKPLTRFERVQRAMLAHRMHEASTGVDRHPSMGFSPAHSERDPTNCIRFSPHCCFVAEGLSIAVSPLTRVIPPVTLDILPSALDLCTSDPSSWRVEATLVSLTFFEEEGVGDQFNSERLASAQVISVCEDDGEQVQRAVFQALQLPHDASGCRIAFTLLFEATTSQDFPVGPTICTGALFICEQDAQQAGFSFSPARQSQHSAPIPTDDMDDISLGSDCLEDNPDVEATKRAAQRLLRYKLGRLRRKHDLESALHTQLVEDDPASYVTVHLQPEGEPEVDARERPSARRPKRVQAVQSRSGSAMSKGSSRAAYSARQASEAGVGVGVGMEVPNASAMLARLEGRMHAILKWSLIPDPELKDMIEELLIDVQGLKEDADGGRSPSPRLPAVGGAGGVPEAPTVSVCKQKPSGNFEYGGGLTLMDRCISVRFASTFVVLFSKSS